MLPRRLYEILPFLYLFTGIVSALLIHSRLVMIASALMIVTGVIILYLRISNRRTHEQRRMQSQSGHIGIRSPRYIKRSAMNRRRFAAKRFPLQDAAGNPVESDRRIGDRRLPA